MNISRNGSDRQSLASNIRKFSFHKKKRRESAFSTLSFSSLFLSMFKDDFYYLRNVFPDELSVNSRRRLCILRWWEALRVILTSSAVHALSNLANKKKKNQKKEKRMWAWSVLFWRVNRTCMQRYLFFWWQKMPCMPLWPAKERKIAE